MKVSSGVYYLIPYNHFMVVDTCAYISRYGKEINVELHDGDGPMFVDDLINALNALPHLYLGEL